MSRLLLEPGTLWSKSLHQTAHALRCGALQPLATEREYIEQGGIRFLVRVLVNLARKDDATKRALFNPFLPYEKDLFVAAISDAHLCLLNKYNVVDHHLLIVTRDFEEQEAPLTLADFEALWACLLEFDSLGFYNSGAVAGASQRHKHLQLVPLPLADQGPALPIEPALTESDSPKLPFRHVFLRLPAPATCQSAFAAYHAALRAVGWQVDQPGPYNLLVTRGWLLLVPRAQERFADISVNALGFAGALLVKDQAQLQRVKQVGPLTILQKVTFPGG
jgi:ATP adenylyltransferase